MPLGPKVVFTRSATAIAPTREDLKKKIGDFWESIINNGGYELGAFALHDMGALIKLN